MATTESFVELRAAAIDGRTHNIYYRQHQLEALHQGLLAHASEIQEAIAADYEHSPSEIAIELHLVISSLRTSYETLQPKKALADEYLVASGKDAPNHRFPAGIVYIEPCKHTLLFSIVAPLSAAIAAGNCVILHLADDSGSLTSVLRNTLQQALHSDTFAIASSSIRDSKILDRALVVDQNCGIGPRPKANILASPSRSHVVAVVDRTANIKLAARELAAAKIGFGGTSPYAPDVVLVNEFVKEEFLRAVAEERAKMSMMDGSKKLKSNRDSDIKAHEENDAAVFDAPARRSESSETNTASSALDVFAVKSLDDAIDYLGSACVGPALAAYHFGNPQVGKYLAQFVDARVSFVNHVNRELLVGPARPAAHGHHSSLAYTVDMFSLPRPAFIRTPASSSKIAAAMSTGSASVGREILEQALSPLKTMKRKPGGGIGFFEQGLLISVGLILTMTISASGAGLVWIVRNGWIPSMSWTV
ncbi:unnamed protein product [Zymoseptoria tritici ST99CH_3D7]|uniref:Aldehyde dehydrogenase domain-containing protein n=1 Tax=Zymoseptoria tritici (strain ST99CH_3D7) TaxID=1276538 RepID=A0A1X7RVU9_ZYMT9|nr:unnamed protein product [Zymoseptoria tritici ST99CH_3D7]